jgi:hypothetical protein
MSNMDRQPNLMRNGLETMTYSETLANLGEGALAKEVGPAFDESRFGAQEGIDFLSEEIDEAYPSLVGVRNSIKKHLKKDEMTNDDDELRILTHNNNMVDMAVNTVAIMFGNGIGDIVRNLDPSVVDLYLPSALQLSSDFTEQAKITREMRGSYPEFAILRLLLFEKGFKAAESIEIPAGSSDIREEKDKMSYAFYVAALSMYYAVAGALGATDKVMPLSDPNQIWQDDQAPSPNNLHDAVIKNKFLQHSIHTAHKTVNEEEFDAEVSFEDSFALLSLFNKVMESHEKEKVFRTFDADGIEITQHTAKVMDDRFKECAFGVLNILYLSDQQDIRGAIQSMDRDIINDTAPIAYQRAKNLSWDHDADLERDSELISKYPYLQLLKASVESYAASFKMNSNGTDARSMNEYVAAYHGGMSVLLTLAWYIEQANPGISREAIPTNFITEEL